MRSAAIIARVDAPERIFDPKVLGEAISNGRSCESFVEQAAKIEIAGRSWGVFSTMWVGPHVDDVVGDFTVGVVLASSGQYLFTGNGRRVASLSVGDVYLLNNKRLHGALIEKGRSIASPLVFAATDFHAVGMPEARVKADQIVREVWGSR